MMTKLLNRSVINNFLLATAVLLLSAADFALAAPAAGSGATKFVDDHLIAYVREGQGEDKAVIETLTSGSTIQVLESNEKYSRVKTASGKTGWILNQYIRDDPIAAQKLMEAQKKIALLESRLKQREVELADVNKGHNDLRKRFESMESKLHRIEAENRNVRKMAEDPLQLAHDVKALSFQRKELQMEVKELREHMSTLKDATENRWFLTGAGVVFISLLVGILMPKFSKRKSNWSSF